MTLFEFGEYWDTTTFILILTVGFALCYFTKKARVADKELVLVIKKSKIHLNKWCILIFVLLLFLYTFKDISFGADSEYYVKTFLASTSFNNTWNVGLEPLYKLFNYVVRHITDNYTLYFFFAGLFIATGYTYFIREFWINDNSLLIFLVLVSTQFFYDMNIMRSAMGGTFILFSFCALKNMDFKRAVILTMIGVFFQVTLIVNIPFIILYWILARNGKVKFLKTIVILVIALIATYVVCLIANRYIAVTRYAYYSSGQDMNPTLIGNWPILISGILSLMMLNNRNECNSKIDLAILSSIFSLVLVIPVIMLGAYRLTMYFYLPRLYMWGYFFKKYIADNQGNRIIKNIFAIAIVLFYTLFVISRRSSIYGFTYRLTDLFR